MGDAEPLGLGLKVVGPGAGHGRLRQPRQERLHLGVRQGGQRLGVAEEALRVEGRGVRYGPVLEQEGRERRAP